MLRCFEFGTAVTSIPLVASGLLSAPPQAENTPAAIMAEVSALTLSE
jgi:hypothetical protein